MSVLDATMWTVHVAVAALWTGSVLFVTTAVLPSATAGDAADAVFGAIVSKLRWITRFSALALLITGGHMAASRYTVETLTGTGRGHLVLSMFVLWFVLAGLVEAASGKVSSGLDAGKLREPARNAKPLFTGAAVVSVLLLVTAGLLASDVVV